MTQKSKLVTPDVVFNILNAELSSLATSFTTSLNVGLALVEDPGNQLVESYKLSPVLHVQDSPVPRSVLVRKCVQDFIEKVQGMRRVQSNTSLVARAPVESPPAERPAEPLMDFLVNDVEVTSRIPTPPLITRCDKSTQTDPPLFLSNRLEGGPWNSPIKDSNPGRFQKTLFCWCPTIILFLHWVMMESSFNL
ncbi:uncharacterized protein TNIN_198121 [Trichonephila inaurata madagascariensis]|uniref:Uncharacterized protein n=1 Tax=Trichonephila inaurata madagascariensis TaxID=2747483 RepID=A0A8X7C9C2_9ARAC|nr:uncharacterized protein TNIN_198121 [Trichonephila inaurata madagascariensis]